MTRRARYAAALLAILAIGTLILAVLPTPHPPAHPGIPVAATKRALPPCTGIVNQQCQPVGDDEPIIDPCHPPRWAHARPGTYPCSHRHHRQV